MSRIPPRLRPERLGQRLGFRIGLNVDLAVQQEPQLPVHLHGRGIVPAGDNRHYSTANRML